MRQLCLEMDDFATQAETQREVLCCERSTTVSTVPHSFGGPGSWCVEFCYFGFMGITINLTGLTPQRKRTTRWPRAGKGHL